MYAAYVNSIFICIIRAATIIATSWHIYTIEHLCSAQAREKLRSRKQMASIRHAPAAHHACVHSNYLQTIGGHHCLNTKNIVRSILVHNFKASEHIKPGRILDSTEHYTTLMPHTVISTASGKKRKICRRDLSCHLRVGRLSLRRFNHVPVNLADLWYVS